MALTDIASAAIGRIAGQFARRAVCWVLVCLFGLAALYQASVAAVVALELAVGAVYAHLILAGIYALAAIAIVTFLWVTVRRPFVDEEFRNSFAALPAEAKVATIIEALLLGYAMSRKKK